MKKSKFLIMLVIFCSCNAEQRLARIVKRNPHLVKSDTIKVRDTIYVKGVTKDSTFYYRTSDTVVIQKDKLEIKYFFNNSDSTVYIQGKCKGDTIYKDRIVYVNTLNVAKALTRSERFKIWMFENWWWILGILSVVVFVVWKIIRMYIKPI